MNSDNGERAPVQGVEIEEKKADLPPEQNAVEQGSEAAVPTDLGPDAVQTPDAVNAAAEAGETAKSRETEPAVSYAQPSMPVPDEITTKTESYPAEAGEPEGAMETAPAPAQDDQQQRAAIAVEPVPAQDDQQQDSAAIPEADGRAAAESAATGGATKHRWYVVHVYSGYEQKARRSLLERIKQAGMESAFGEVLIPTETVQETRGKSSRLTSKTFYPGYIFVQMSMNDHAWHLVRDTPKITGFVGGRYPRPVPAPEIASVVQQVEEGAAKPRPQVQFEQGDQVRVIDGAFANFTGAVEDVKPEKQKVRVLVSIFGRATPVELDYSQVEKTA